MSAHVTFERIGRNHNVPDLPLVCDPTDLDAVAEAVYRLAGRHLASRDYDVTVSPEGTVLVGWGRFGKGQVVTDG